MSLRVVFYLPEVHTHACLVAKQWLLNASRGEVMVITTPKLQTGKRSSIAQLFRIIRQSGCRYLLDQVRMTRAYLSAAQSEANAAMPFAERTNLRPEDLSRLDGVSLHRVVDINSREAQNLLTTFQPEVSVAVFFNQILKADALAVPSLLALNVHPSLLPSYRGISPVFRVLAHGEAQAGISVHRMTQKLDFGDVFAQRSTAIEEADSVFRLYRRLADLGSKCLNDVLHKLNDDEALQLIEPSGDATRYGPIDRAALKAFRKRGRSWFRKRDLHE